MVLISLVCALSVTAQERIEKRYSIFFRAGKSDIDHTYMDNGHTIRTMMDDIKATLDVDGNALDSLLVYSSTSPEGSASLNERLATQRAENSLAILKSMFSDLNPDQIKVEHRVNDWSGMIQTLRRDETIRYRDDILKVLTDPNISNKEAAVRAMPHAYAEIRDNMFDRMRTATITLRVIGAVDEYTAVSEESPIVEEVEKLPAPEVVVEEPVVIDVPEPAEPVETVVQEPLKPFYLAVKTNMLYDAALVPNVGLEVYLGNNISVVGNWMYSWWKSDDVSWYWRIYGGDLAVRYWFGKSAQEKPLQGHHLGLYGQMITYDFEVGGRGILADRWSWSCGLEYGYSLPITYRLNIDFTLGAGYHWGEFEEYLPIDGHYVWQATKKRQYLGPTKFEVSLVWLLGRGNYNSNKKKNR